MSHLLAGALRDLIDAIPESTLDADPPLLCWVEYAEKALMNDVASSRLGALAAAERAPSQINRMLAEYSKGPLTDLEMRGRLGLPESRISARRSALMSRGWVCWVEDTIGPCWITNGRYGLTEQGRAVVRNR